MIQKTMSLLPRNLGFRINEKLVLLVRGGVESRQDLSIRFQKGVENLQLIKAKLDSFSLNNKTALEIGTGWHGVDLVIFHLMGVRQIITIDQHHHLNNENLVATIKTLKNPQCYKLLLDAGAIPERINELLRFVETKAELQSLLTFMNINYLILQSQQYKNLHLGEEKIDFFYSESVLHRIPEADLHDLLNTVSRHLSDNAISFHRTDQKDINAQDHVDKGLWPLHYLKYNELIYTLFFSRRFNSQNRLRESDFITLFEKSGMTLVFTESFYRKNDIERLRGHKIATRFKNKSIEDLAILYSKIISIKNPSTKTNEYQRKLISE